MRVQFVEISKRASALNITSSQVDLETDDCTGNALGQGLGLLRRTDRLPQRNVGHQAVDFVGLESSLKRPPDPGVGNLLGLLNEFVGIILAESGQAGTDRRPDHVDPEPLGNRHNADVVDGASGGGDRVTHGLKAPRNFCHQVRIALVAHGTVRQRKSAWRSQS